MVLTDFGLWVLVLIGVVDLTFWIFDRILTQPAADLVRKSIKGGLT